MTKTPATAPATAGGESVESTPLWLPRNYRILRTEESRVKCGVQYVILKLWPRRGQLVFAASDPHGKSVTLFRAIGLRYGAVDMIRGGLACSVSI